MLRSRLIPCLLIKDDGLVKTIKFSDPKYVGDPINAIRIFNEKKCDELMILDIDATVLGREPNLSALKNFATESRMPLCYGGGIKSLEMASQIIGLGIEKVAISSQALSNLDLIGDMTTALGSQSVVVVLDYKKDFFGRRHLFTHNGKKRARQDFWDFVRSCQAYGVGELVFNCIDKDGTHEGFDLELAERLRQEISVPVTVMGGAKDHANIQTLAAAYGPLGIGVGSLFVFKGKHRAVLINYPQSDFKKTLVQKLGNS